VVGLWTIPTGNESMRDAKVVVVIILGSDGAAEGNPAIVGVNTDFERYELEKRDTINIVYRWGKFWGKTSTQESGWPERRRLPKRGCR